MEQYCFGVDVGGTSVKIGLFHVDSTLVEKWEIVTRKENSGSFILEDISNSLKAKLQERNLSKGQIQGIGIGVPGPVRSDGTVFQCVNLGWGVVNVVDIMQKLTEISNVRVGNDANVAALGEMWQGGGKGYKNVALFTLGTGVGGGIIVDGEIIAGSHGGAGEVGHITVSYEEEEACNCGKKGCLEQFASATGIVKEANRLLLRSNEPSKLRERQSISAKAIFDLAKEGDALSLKLVDQLGRYLAIAASHVSGVVDPEVFVLGGGVSRAGDILIDTIKKHYSQFVMDAFKDTEFKLAELENDAGIFGSARMVLDD